MTSLNYNVNDLYSACTHLADFRLPLPKNTTNFSGSLKSCLHSPEAVDFTNNLALSRVSVVNSLYAKEPIENSLEKIDQYLAAFNLFSRSIEVSHSASPSGIDLFRFDQELIFEWRGHLTGESLFFMSTQLTFEKIMLLHAKAVLHHEKAKKLLSLDVVGMLSEAGKQLLLAASIMDYICNLIPAAKISSQRLNKQLPNPPEVDEAVCRGLYHYYKGSAQAMSAVKSMSTPSAGSSFLRSRLCMAVANSSKKSLELISTVAAASGPNFLLLVHIAASRELFSGLVYKYLAEMSMEKNEIGLTLAYCTIAKPHLVVQQRSVYVVSHQGLPSSSYLVGAIAYLNEAITAMYTTADRDNRFIHFQVVPTELPPLPQEASVMNPGQYSDAPIVAAPITFSFMHKKSLFESMFSRTPAPAPTKAPAALLASSAPAAPTSAPAPTSAAPAQVPYGRVVTVDSAATGSGSIAQADAGTSDEIIARELQRQFDEEAAMLTSSSSSIAPPPPQPPSQTQTPPFPGNSLF